MRDSPSPIRLSDEQQAVVDYPLLPLRVSAGAGTGKTTTVSYRMARLVEEEGVPPDQILGLTFTNKAAEELSHRTKQVLAETLPEDRARQEPSPEIQVSTYHSFCYQIVAEFGAVLEIERNPPIISPAQTRQLVKQVIRRNPLPDLDNTDMFWLPGAIVRLSSSLADHLLDPDCLEERTKRMEIPQLHRGDFRLKRHFDDYQRLVSTLSRRLGMVKAAQAYQARKRELGVVDYGDLITRAHRIVATHERIAQRIRSRYQAAVADEYQDTNAAQRRILQTLFGDGFPLTVVGDPDQTLYEWRGASLDNFKDFPEHFPTREGKPAETLTLTLNRRSGANIIRFSNRLQQEIGTKTPPLQALPDPPPSLVTAGGLHDYAPPSSVTAEWLPTYQDEAVWIAEQMKERHTQGRSWREMAVLFRKTKDIRGVYKHLIDDDIPVEVAGLGGLLIVPEVGEIHSWMKVIGRFDDRVAAARLLAGSRFRLGLADIRRLARYSRRDPDRPPRAMLDGLEYSFFWEELPDSATADFRRFHRQYRRLLSACQSRTPGEVCHMILAETGAWADVESMSDNARTSARLNLYRFLNLAESWSPLESPATLEGFLDYLDAIMEEPAEEVEPARLSGEDAVALLTVHKAKGLEWPVVFIPAIYQGNFPSHAVGGYNDPYRNPTTLPWDWWIDPPTHTRITARTGAAALTEILTSSKEETRAAHQSAEWRVAYVAATRAKEDLVLSGAHWYGYPEPTVKAKLPHKSDFFEKAWESTRNAEQDLKSAYPVPPRPSTFADPPQASSAPDPLFGEGGWSEAIRRAIEEPDSMAETATLKGVGEEYQEALEEFRGLLFRLPEPELDTRREMATISATGLVAYAQCPKKYFWTAVDPLPRSYSYVTRRGTRIHRQIELHHQGKVPLLEPEDEFVDLGSDDRPVDFPSGPEPFQVFLASRFSNMEIQWLEKAFTLRLNENFLVRGRIDAVYRGESGGWEIVDFKSGRAPADDPHSARLAQMQVYALAVREIPELGPAPADLSVTIAYLGGGRLAESPSAEEADGEWLTAARGRLEDMARSISEERWDPTPSAACRGCDFLHVCPEGKVFINSIGRKS